MEIDFARVAAAALADAERLCRELLGGKRVGSEWVGERTANGGPGDSWSVNLNTGQWLHGASNAAGGDLISLHASFLHLSQLEAAKHLTAKLNGALSDPQHSVRQRLDAAPAAMAMAEPIPADAPPPPDHKDHGKPESLYVYTDSAGAPLFVIARYRAATGKSFSQWTWRAGKWTAKSYPAPRPLYGLHDLAKRPTLPVLIVEGEKCADAARAALKASYCVVTWAGGAQAVKTADWTPLKGRTAVLWPDADVPGAHAIATLAEILLPIAKSVAAVRPHGMPEGWDVADAIGEGVNVLEFIGARLKPIRAPESKATESKAVESETPDQKSEPAPKQKSHTGRKHDAKPPVIQSGDSAVSNWQSLALSCNSGGIPHPTIANASIIIRQHPELTGHVWYDKFRGQIYQDLRGPTAQWTDHDDLRLTAWIQQSLNLPAFTLGLIKEAVTHAALLNERNSVVDWLNSLEWDGITRLESWLSDCLGVALTPYSRAVAKNWLISMVARAFQPGCQVDHMPILEGKMGRGKSSFLRLLGGEWYSALPDAFGSKDFLQGIVGQWLIEVPDLAGFNRREHQHILAIITTPKDRYRASYGRHTEEHPRTCLFTATSESDEYLQDARGRRRFWPLRCQSIDLEALHANRDQLFAEAVSCFRNHATWHETPEREADAEQLERVDDDAWTERIMEYVEGRTLNSYGAVNVPVMTSTAILSALGLDLKDQHDGQKRRIKHVMEAHGYVQKIEKNQGRSVRKWVKE